MKQFQCKKNEMDVLITLKKLLINKIQLERKEK